MAINFELELLVGFVFGIIAGLIMADDKNRQAKDKQNALAQMKIQLEVLEALKANNRFLKALYQESLNSGQEENKQTNVD